MSQRKTYLLIDLPLKLDHLVLHPNVEFLQVLRRAGLDLQRLQLLPGLHPPVVALQHDGGTSDAAEASPGQPATGVLLEDRGFVFRQDLLKTKMGRNVTIKGEKPPAKGAVALVLLQRCVNTSKSAFQGSSPSRRVLVGAGGNGWRWRLLFYILL